MSKYTGRPSTMASGNEVVKEKDKIGEAQPERYTSSEKYSHRNIKKLDIQFIIEINCKRRFIIHIATGVFY